MNREEKITTLYRQLLNYGYILTLKECEETIDKLEEDHLKDVEEKLIGIRARISRSSFMVKRKNHEGFKIAVLEILAIIDNEIKKTTTK